MKSSSLFIACALALLASAQAHATGAKPVFKKDHFHVEERANGTTIVTSSTESRWRRTTMWNGNGSAFTHTTEATPDGKRVWKRESHGLGDPISRLTGNEVAGPGRNFGSRMYVDLKTIAPRLVREVHATGAPASMEVNGHLLTISPSPHERMEKRYPRLTAAAVARTASEVLTDAHGSQAPISDERHGLVIEARPIE